MSCPANADLAHALPTIGSLLGTSSEDNADRLRIGAKSLGRSICKMCLTQASSATILAKAVSPRQSLLSEQEYGRYATTRSSFWWTWTTRCSRTASRGGRPETGMHSLHRTWKPETAEPFPAACGDGGSRLVGTDFESEAQFGLPTCLTRRGDVQNLHGALNPGFLARPAASVSKRH